ncbi:type III secretion chaperone SycN [Vibrio sp. NH-UV-68]|uniref:type III secretion chaperone SycN n=1 Tax=unclassified Vibrio TaxID=2614977 RepID=UPI0036F3B69F
MNWIDDSVDDFCRAMGVENVDFSCSGRVQLTFQCSGTLHIEKHQGMLFMMLAREILRSQSAKLIKRALAICNDEQGWPFLVRASLLGENTLVFSAQMAGEEVTHPSLEQALAMLIRLHNNMVN